MAITLVVDATPLGGSLNVPPGGVAFYPLTVALAAIGVIGACASGPLCLGRRTFPRRLRRPVILPILLGRAAAAVFIVGAVVVWPSPEAWPRADRGGTDRLPAPPGADEPGGAVC